MQLLLAPPPQYDHPYSGQVIEQRLSQAELMRLCRGPAEGCASVINGVCHIALPTSEKDPMCWPQCGATSLRIATAGPPITPVAIG
jgi:hypothetical protein